jgi:hypothetical protein
MLATEDMAHVNTAKQRALSEVCMQQQVWKHCTLVIRIDFAAAINTITAVVYGAAAERNQQRILLHSRTSDRVSGNLVSEILNRFCPVILLFI